MNEVNQRIAKCRKRAGLRQEDMAEKLNIKPTTYSQMERNGNITAERLFAMAEIFGVTPCTLYYGKELCNKENPLSVKEVPTLALNQSAPHTPEKKIFIPSKKEESLLSLLRNFSKEDAAKIYDLAGKLYQESKKPK